MSIALTDKGFSVERPKTAKPRRKLIAEWVSPNDGVRIVARLEDGSVLLVEMPGAGRGSRRLPGGWVEEGETAHEAAIELLHLETGFRALRWAAGGVTPAQDTIRRPVHYFEARSMRFDPDAPIADGSPRASWFSLGEAVEMAREELVEDLSALQILRLAATEDGFADAT